MALQSKEFDVMPELGLSGEAQALFGELRTRISATSPEELPDLRVALERHAKVGAVGVGQYIDTVYQDRYQDTVYDDHYKDTTTYRDAAR